MKTNQPTTSSAKQQEAQDLQLLENDAVWDLLNDAKPAPAGPDELPMFSRNVLRQIRLMESNSPSTPWYKRLKFALPIALGAAATCLIAISQFNATPSHPTATTAQHQTSAKPSTPATQASDDTNLDEEIYIYQDSDPFFISAEEIDAIVSM